LHLAGKKYYKLYSKILSVIKEAKKMNYNRRILKSSNNNKTTWDIIKLEIGKNFPNGDNQVLDIKGKSSDQRDIADAFNNYFLSIADTITEYKTHNNNKIGTDKILLPLISIFYHKFLKICFLLWG
jgi:hypothetical protein